MLRVPRAPAIETPAFCLRATLFGAALGWATLAGAAPVAGVCTMLDLTDDAPALSDSPSLEVSADDVDWVSGGTSSLRGGVELRQDNKVFRTEALEFEEDQDKVRVRVKSVFRNPEFIIHSDATDFDLRAETGVFLGTRFTLTSRAARGGAGQITFGADGTAELSTARYTTCDPANETWLLEARRIRLDTEQGLGTASHARLRFAGVPVLYLPWFQFPIDDRRRSGLLYPTFGQSDRTGLDVRWPIYLNLAPQYDATITPRYMARRGLLIGSEGRYLTRESEGQLGIDWLHRDELTDESRRYLRAEHRGLINDRLALDLRYAEISDQQYFEDLGGELDLTAITHLERSARLTYQAPGAYLLTALVQDYQTIARNLDPADEPYRRLPQLTARALTRQSLFNTRAGIHAEYVNFVRSDSLEGQRVDLRPFVRFEQDLLSRYMVAELDYRHTRYQLSTTTPDTPDRQPSRSLPSLGFEGGLRFDRLTSGGNRQTLEPRALYLYVPHTEQDQLPLFDSGEPDFDFTQLFARNRYSGEDRVSDAHHVAVAATSRLLDPMTGEVRWTASLGQLYRLQAPRVELPGTTLPDNGPTDFIASVDYRLSRRFAASVAAQWSPDEERFDRSQLALRYREGQRDVLLSYRYRQGLLEQADLGINLPLGRSVSLLSRWRYSIADDQTLDLYAGLGYDTCCWGIRTAYRRYIASTDGRYDNGVYIQLELKGLTRIGGGYEPLLPGRDRPSL